MPPRKYTALQALAWSLLFGLCACTNVMDLGSAGGGNGDPFNGGDPFYVTVGIARRNIRTGMESILHATDLSTLCSYAACRQENTHCQALRDLTPQQVTSCRNFLSTNAQAISGMNTTDPQFEPVKINLVKGPLFGADTNEYVTANTQSNPSSPIFLDRERASQLSQEALTSLLTHEFGHKVGAPNYVLDDVAINGFSTGREFLDTVGSALVAYITDVLNLELNGSTATVNTGLAPKYLVLPNGDMMKIIRSQSASGYVELEIASQQSGYQNIRYAVLPYQLYPASICEFTLKGYDLVCVLGTKSGSNRVEIHSLTAASNYTEFNIHLATERVLTPPNVIWEYKFLEDDFMLVMKNHSGSGFLEFHVLSAASTYQTYIVHTATNIPKQEGADYETAVIGRNVALIRTRGFAGANPNFELREIKPSSTIVLSSGVITIPSGASPLDIQWNARGNDIVATRFRNAPNSRVEFSIFPSSDNFKSAAQQIPTGFLIR